LVVAFLFTPAAVVLAGLPALLLIACVLWIDRLEPEPSASRIHALLWGATVAVVVSGVVNGVVAVSFGESVAAVFSAPLVEELLKALGIWWAVRRGEVDSATNGVVYAMLVAAGFAAVENVVYFAGAAGVDALAEVFVVRGLFTPFAHPLFTIWTGFCLGRAVASARQSGRLRFGVLKKWFGLPVAVVLHAAWNALALHAPGALAVMGFATFFAFFVATVVWLTIARRRALAAFVNHMPATVFAAHLDRHWVAVFSSWSSILKARKSLPRRRRAAFDRVHAAMSRLVDYRHSPHADRSVEQRLLVELRAAVFAFGPWPPLSTPRAAMPPPTRLDSVVSQGAARATPDLVGQEHRDVPVQLPPSPPRG
jgi:RsiW-degrading membrane proteinase PrsW (M82 family)